MTQDVSNACSICNADLEDTAYYCTEALTGDCPSVKLCNACLCYDCGKCPSCDECIKKQTGNLFCKSCGQVETHSLQDTTLDDVAARLSAYCDICYLRFNEDALNLQEKWCEGTDYDFLTLVLRLTGGGEEDDGADLLCHYDEEENRDVLYCRGCDKNILHRSLEATDDPPYAAEALECETCGTTRYGRYRMLEDGSVIDVDGMTGPKGGVVGSPSHPSSTRYSGYPNYEGGAVHYCKHWQQEVQIGDYTILCSASADSGLAKGPRPDIGIYFSAWAWSAQIMVTPKFPRDIGLTVDTHPTIVYDWGDMAAPNGGVVRRLVEVAVEYLKAGKVVDIGCLGGHGRTGTFLALLVVELEKCKAEEAIHRVRSRYCEKAVESYAQRAFVYKYSGETPPPMPATPRPHPVTPIYHYKSRQEKRAAKRRRKQMRRDFKNLVESAKRAGVSRQELEREAKFWRCTACCSIRRDNINTAGVMQSARWFTFCTECNKSVQHERPLELYTELRAE